MKRIAGLVIIGLLLIGMFLAGQHNGRMATAMDIVIFCEEIHLIVIAPGVGYYCAPVRAKDSGELKVNA